MDGRLADESEIKKAEFERLTKQFKAMMKRVHDTGGAVFSIELLTTDEARSFIDSHAEVLNSSFRKTEMSDAMRKRLERSNWVFSGMKTFHEMNEAFPSMLDEYGNRKPFETFLNDVRSIDETYNRNYLRSEYNFVSASAEMAAKWEDFSQDGDRYDLQYRTAGDERVRPEHAAMDGITLPYSDPFWEDFTPPNGWNCRCTVVQVRRGKYERTDSDVAQGLGALATQSDKKGMFRFNPGAEGKTVPDYNPYTISKCKSCPIAKEDTGELMANIPTNQNCEACRIVRAMKEEYSYYSEDRNIRIHKRHGKAEKQENLDIATYFSSKYGYQIDLLPVENREHHREADTFNRTLGYKQEYKVNKTNSKNAVDCAIRSGAGQADSIVLAVNSDITFSDLMFTIKNRIKRTENVFEIVIIKDGKDATYTRDFIMSDDFKIKLEDFK